jgi:hypothetical protein
MNIGETTEDVQHQASEIEIQTHQKLDSTLDQEPNPQITPQHLACCLNASKGALITEKSLMYAR